MDILHHIRIGLQHLRNRKLQQLPIKIFLQFSYLSIYNIRHGITSKVNVPDFKFTGSSFCKNNVAVELGGTVTL